MGESISVEELSEEEDEVESSEFEEPEVEESSELDDDDDDDDDSFVSGCGSPPGVASGNSSGITMRFCAREASHNVLNIARTSMLCEPPEMSSFKRNDDFEPAIF